MSIRVQDIKSRRLGAAATLAAIAMATAPAAFAADAGMVVVKDPDTGQLRAPTAEEMRLLQSPSTPAEAARASQLRVAPVVTRMSNGASKIVLDDSTHSYTVVTRQADGSLAEQCVTGPEAAVKAMTASNVVPAKSGKTAKATKSTQEHHHDAQ